MKVKTEILEKRFAEFAKFIGTREHKNFTSFRTSKYVDREENYKYSLYEKARGNLEMERWRSENIGSGIIHKKATSALRSTVNHNGRKFANNLVRWNKTVDFSRIGKIKGLEETLFNFYKSRISDQQAFDNFVQAGLSYQLIAYLFFIKDSNRFMPISQQQFDKTFELIGLHDFKTSRRTSWDNYSTYNDIISQVRDFLQTKDSNATLLDAHSFLWILSRQMKAKHTTQLRAAEEDDEKAFPEGKDRYRLHKSKERNRALIKAAKERRLKTDPKLGCDVCGFTFIDKYGELGEGFVEAHHLFPISELTEETKTKTEDLALVCSNCHRMLHRKRPWLTLDQLKTLIIT